MPEKVYFLYSFQIALETHENLLHAETQAIAAKHLDTIEEILQKKDRSLQILLSNKADLPEKFLDDRKINEQIERVLQLQQRNADSFKKFFDERSRKEKGLEENLRVIKDYERFTLIQIANPFDQFIESCRERFKTIELIVT